MRTYYDYYKEICACPGIRSSSAGDLSYYYSYYAGICVCPNSSISIGMRDLEGNETGNFPVEVYNVNEELIGGAIDKQNYISLWNSDAANQAIGTLGSGPGPFLFSLSVKNGAIAPPWVIGVAAEIEFGIYGIQYGSEYE